MRFNKSKKGQAAMEFLMTYGWAILVVLVAIGALAYFGVLSPDSMLPQKTTFGPQISNIGDAYVQTDGSVQVALKNTGGFDLTITNVTVTGDCPTFAMVSPTDVELAAGVSFPNGNQSVFEWDCGVYTAKKAKMDVKLEYTYDQTGVGGGSTGSIVAKVQ